MTIKVAIPFQNSGKIELEGDFDEILENISHLKDIFEALGAEVGAITLEPPVTITHAETQEGATEEPPMIPVEMKDKLTEALTFLIGSNWALKPRSFKEIMNALEQNAMHRPKGTVASTLLGLVKQNKIRRTKDARLNQWIYSKF